MKKIWGLFAGICLISRVAWADDAAVSVSQKPTQFFGTTAAEAVLQNPSKAMSGVKGIFETVQPGVESVYDFHHHRFIYGTSAALWNFSSRSFPLGSLRVGYAASGVTPYSEVQLDLPGLAGRFISPYLPSSMKAVLTAGALDGAWRLFGKYALVGGVVGYGFDQTATATTHNGGVLVGVSMGAKLTF